MATHDTVTPTSKSPQPDPEIIEAHRVLVVWLFIGTAIVSVICAVLAFISFKTHRGPTILMFVVLAGTLGGFVSSLRRVYKFQEVMPRRFLPLFTRKSFYLVLYSFVPALIGAIFATVAYVAFAANLVQGPLVPNFHCSATDCRTLDDIVDFWSPAAPGDYMKVIVWGFIAGFSERFVVGFLDKLGAGSHK